MEHILIRFFIISCLFFCIACEKQLANPELADPIYQDLQAQKANATKALDSKQKELDAAEKDGEKANLDPVETKQNRKTRFNLQKTLRLLQQDKTYFEIKMAERKDYDVLKYSEVFNKKEHWPIKGEIESYQVEKRLREASRNWNDRVPKPANAPTAAPKVIKPEKKEE